MTGDVPHEGHQFAGDGHHNDILVLAACDKLTVAGAQANLRLPGDLAELQWRVSWRIWISRLTLAG